MNQEAFSYLDEVWEEGQGEQKKCVYKNKELDDIMSTYTGSSQANTCAQPTLTMRPQVFAESAPEFVAFDRSKGNEFKFSDFYKNEIPIITSANQIPMQEALCTKDEAPLQRNELYEVVEDYVDAAMSKSQSKQNGIQSDDLKQILIFALAGVLLIFMMDRVFVLGMNRR